MYHKMPPLNPLRTFEVVARRKSFTEAAIELLVTQAAVSRQVNVLEDYFNVKLFEREPRSLVLTDAGQRLYQEIGPAFEAIGWATYDILQKREGKIITLQTYPTLTAMRILPRLNEFISANDGICLNFQTDYSRGHFVEDNADIFIRFGTEMPPNMRGFRFAGMNVTPAASPELFEKCGHDPERLIKEQPILISKHCQSDWSDWAQMTNLNTRNTRVMTFDSSLYAYNAARDGFGVCVAEQFLVACEVEAGRLIQPFKEVVHRNTDYWCIWSENRRVTPQLTRTLEWLKSLAEPEQLMSA